MLRQNWDNISQYTKQQESSHPVACMFNSMKRNQKSFSTVPKLNKSTFLIDFQDTQKVRPVNFSSLGQKSISKVIVFRIVLEFFDEYDR